ASSRAGPCNLPRQPPADLRADYATSDHRPVAGNATADPRSEENLRNSGLVSWARSWQADDVTMSAMPWRDPVNPAGPGVKLTYDDFLLFPDDGKRHELIDGVHYVTPSPIT